MSENFGRRRWAVAVLQENDGSNSYMGALQGVGRAWSHGADLDWQAVGLDRSAAAASLPPAPLRGNVCDGASLLPANPLAPDDTASGPRQWLRSHVMCTRPTRRFPNRLGERQTRWLLIVDTFENWTDFAEFLEDHAQVVSLVRQGAATARMTRGRCTSDLTDDGSMLSLMRDLRAHDLRRSA